LIGLDQRLRRGSPYLYAHRQGWLLLNPREVDLHFDSGRLPPALLGLLSMYPSGYVREGAIRRLANRPDGSEIPYLLIRLNDWVAPVREAARAALRSRIQPGYARHLIGNLPLLLRLSECGRDDHAPFVSSVLQFLKETDCRSALLEGLASPDRSVRRACFHLAIEAVDFPMSVALGRGLRDDDPLIRLWAARTARLRLAPGEYLGLVPEMGNDRFMPVRREALSGLVEEVPDGAPAALRAALLDTHPSIREVARYYLNRFGVFDARAFYREVIHSDTQDTQGFLSSAIAGLGETGTEDDTGLVLPWLRHPSAKVRRVVVRALGRLAGDAHVNDLLRALEDDRPSVTHAARDALRGRLHLVTGERLWDIYGVDRRPHVRRDALILLAGLGKWSSLPYLLRACSDDDPQVALKAHELLHDWLSRFNQSFAHPTREDLHRAADALESAYSTLDPDVFERLQFSLKGW
jgi:HEAT repeat protein